MPQGISESDALIQAYEAVESGKAYEKFCQWIGEQGGDTSYIEDTSRFKKASIIKEVKAEKGGYITKMDAEKIGSICVDVGGGRKTKEDVIDYCAGIILAKKTGDFAEKGEVIAFLHTNNASALEKAEKDFLSAVEISTEKPEVKPLVYGIVK